MGSPNKFGWLLNQCYIPLASYRELLRDPAAATPCASASLFVQQKFDYAQDDRLTVIYFIPKCVFLDIVIQVWYNNHRETASMDCHKEELL